jgi:hypothetical protein
VDTYKEKQKHNPDSGFELLRNVYGSCAVRIMRIVMVVVTALLVKPV